MASTFDINNFVIDRCLRAIMVDTDTGEILWSINQITEPSIKCESDTTQATDALEVPIMEFDRAKKATFSATNSLFDLGLAAAQFGTKKQVADAESKVIATAFETIDIAAGTAVTLKHTPTEQIKYIYELKGDSTLGKKYTNGAAASDDKFVHAKGTDSVTLPTSLSKGSQLFVEYEYETDEAVKVTNSATKFPKAGKLIVQILGADVCNVSTLYNAYLVFPQAKLSSNVDLTFSTDGKHPFEIQCMQQYCDKEKKLFDIIVPKMPTE